MNQRNAHIIATGSYAPERVVPNSYFNELLGEDVDTWLKEHVQIYSRRWCSEYESTADLVEQACRNALTAAKISPDDIDLLIVATVYITIDCFSCSISLGTASRCDI